LLILSIIFLLYIGGGIKMVTGLLLVKLTSGKEKQALIKLRALKSIVHMSAVFGRWDLVLDMEADDLPQLSNIIVQEIRPIPGVLSTETLVTTTI
jgi:DNA-binding Lrp family transcriptional regulator